jgi:hypothetical protein
MTSIQLGEFEILTAVVMNVAIFWDIAPCSPPATLWFVARLIFGPEDGDNTLFRNVGSHTDSQRYIPKIATFIDSSGSMEASGSEFKHTDERSCPVRDRVVLTQFTEP